MILKAGSKLMSIFIVSMVLLSWSPSSARTFHFSHLFPLQKLTFTNLNSSALLELRGGASKRRNRGGGVPVSSKKSKRRKERTVTGTTKVKNQDDSKPSALGDMLQKYQKILPLTRLYLTSIGIFSLLGAIVGEEVTYGILGLDPVRFIYGMELWRPITAASFLGKPSMQWLMSTYYLFEYGSSLERVYGSAQHLVFLFVQVTLLTFSSILFGMPFFGPSVITSMLHVLSRSMPNQKVRWLIFTVPYWCLPYGLMLSDVLQSGATAALPHVLGILTGHFYYFHKFIWPKIGGEDWLVAPDFLVRRLDPNSSVKNDGRSKMETILKKRKKGKGRKLGG